MYFASVFVDAPVVEVHVQALLEPGERLFAGVVEASDVVGAGEVDVVDAVLHISQPVCGGVAVVLEVAPLAPRSGTG
jgi:hypothetical protein